MEALDSLAKRFIGSNEIVVFATKNVGSSVHKLFSLEHMELVNKDIV